MSAYHNFAFGYIWSTTGLQLFFCYSSRMQENKIYADWSRDCWCSNQIPCIPFTHLFMPPVALAWFWFQWPAPVNLLSRPISGSLSHEQCAWEYETPVPLLLVWIDVRVPCKMRSRPSLGLSLKHTLTWVSSLFCFPYSLADFCWEHLLNKSLAHESSSQSLPLGNLT